MCKRFLPLFLIILAGCKGLGGLFSGGSSFEGMPEVSALSMGVNLRKLKISASTNMNNGTAIKLHLILVSNPLLLKKLMDMDAIDYFKLAPNLEREYPKEYELFEWEVVPGDNMEEEPKIQRYGDALTGFIFASYDSVGSHRARITDDENIMLRLNEKDMDLTAF